jgi:Na+-transporting methylmalonyl-CoA/oxaloacetate decarboxylase gamma subunit
MPALPLVTSGVGTLLAYIALMVALAVLVGAVIGFLAAQREPTSPEETAESTEVLEHFRKAA